MERAHRLRTPLLAGWLLAAMGGCAAPLPTVRQAPPPPPAPHLYLPATAPDGTPLPPVARVAPRTTEVAGRTLVDPYPWLRHRDDPEVISYLEAENHYTEAMMAPTAALRETLYQEMRGRLEETDLSVPYLLDGDYYYTRTEPGKQYPVYCRKRGSLDAAEEVLLDANALAAGHDFLRLGAVEVSPDGTLLAFLVDTDGSESFTLEVKDLASGRLLPDRVTGTSWDLEWGNDDRTLFYTTTDAARRPYRLFRHRLGAGPAGDELVYYEPDEAFELSLSKTRSRRYLLLDLHSSTTGEVRFLDADHPGGAFRVVTPRRHGVEYGVYHHGDSFYVRTNAGAKNYRLLRVPVADLSPGSWREVIPARDDVDLVDVEMFADYMAVLERRGGLPRIRVRAFRTGAEREVTFPEPAYSVRPVDNHDYASHLLRFRYASFVTPPSIFDYDMTTGTRQLRKQTRVGGGYDPARYRSERLAATASDGTAVPISLVYPAGLRRDGSNPCLLYGYGGYGASIDPGFSSSRLSLLDRGFVYAVAHVRGGGEMGERWHDGGKLLTKKNTFTDFIAAAEYLVAQGYTSPRRLALTARSAGGLLAGAVVNLRPDLFAAAVAEVPFVDLMNTMLDPTIPLTVTEWEEWGNPRQPAYFDYMRSYSPYDNIAPRRYPAMLITAGLNDPRVGFWEPAKWTARLRASLPPGQRILLRTYMGAGHAGPSGRYDALREKAFEYAFLFDALGVAGEPPP